MKKEFRESKANYRGTVCDTCQETIDDGCEFCEDESLQDGEIIYHKDRPSSYKSIHACKYCYEKMSEDY